MLVTCPLASTGWSSKGELSERMAILFEDMTLTLEEGNTVPAKPVRDVTELQERLRHVSALGLTLLEATAVEAAAKR